MQNIGEKQNKVFKPRDRNQIQPEMKYHTRGRANALQPLTHNRKSWRKPEQCFKTLRLKSNTEMKYHTEERAHVQ